MLKHGILGLLNYGDMTGYEIMLVFRDSLSYFWPAQTSQIYREQQTLKKNGWVTDQNIPQTGKPDKNLFSITEDGKQELTRWLTEDRPVPEKNSLLMQTFFRGELTPEENIAFFRQLGKSCEDFLENAGKPTGNVALYQAAVGDPRKSLYWQMTIEYGVLYAQMLRTWTERCVTMLKEAEHEHSGN